VTLSIPFLTIVGNNSKIRSSSSCLQGFTNAQKFNNVNPFHQDILVVEQFCHCILEKCEGDTAIDSSENCEGDTVIHSLEICKRDTVIDPSENCKENTLIDPSKGCKGDTLIGPSEKREHHYLSEFVTTTS